MMGIKICRDSPTRRTDRARLPITDRKVRNARHRNLVGGDSKPRGSGASETHAHACSGDNSMLLLQRLQSLFWNRALLFWR